MISAGQPRPAAAGKGRVLFASLVGTTIEFFDFYIYATAAVLVGLADRMLAMTVEFLQRSHELKLDFSSIRKGMVGAEALTPSLRQSMQERGSLVIRTWHDRGRDTVVLEVSDSSYSYTINRFEVQLKDTALRFPIENKPPFVSSIFYDQVLQKTHKRMSFVIGWMKRYFAGEEE